MSQLPKIEGRRFVRNILALAGGQSLAMFIPILSAPLLGRLYTPHDYGLLATYMSIAVVVATIGNWQYAQAIVLESRDRRAWALVRTCLWTSLATAVASLIVPLAAYSMTDDGTALEFLRPWFWLVPLSAFAGGLTTCFTALANRFTHYRLMAAIQVASVLATTLTSIVLGWRGWSTSGLFLGYFTGQLVTFIAYVALYRRLSLNAPQTSPAASRALLRRHRNYPLYTMPTSFIEQISANAPVYALGLLGASGTIGLLTRARQLLAMPYGMLGSSVAQVFQQRAAQDIARQGHCRETFAKTFFAIAGIGIVPTVLLAVAAPWLFEVYLGPKWREAGDVARILAPMLLLQLICSPLSRVFYMRQRQRLDFLLSLASTVLVLLFTGGASVLGWSPLSIVTAYACAGSIIYLVYILIGWSLAQPSPEHERARNLAPA